MIITKNSISLLIDAGEKLGNAIVKCMDNKIRFTK